MYLMIIHIFPLVGHAVHLLRVHTVESVKFEGGGAIFGGLWVFNLLILWNVISLMGRFSVSVKKPKTFQICFCLRCKFVGEGLPTCKYLEN